ncbi:DUF2897 family protein [Candidatus Enterovibrio escicola]
MIVFIVIAVIISNIMTLKYPKRTKFDMK